MFLDAACLALSAFFASAIYGVVVDQRFEAKVHLSAAVIATIAFFLIRQSHGAYSRPFAQLQTVDTTVVFDFVIAALLSSALIWQVGKVQGLSRGLSLLYVATCALSLFMSRFAMKAWLLRLAESGKIRQRVVIYSDDIEFANRACDLLSLENLPQLLLVGIAGEGSSTGTAKHPLVGRLADVVEFARAGEIDQVFILATDMRQEQLSMIVEALSVVSIDISVLPSDLVRLAPHYRVSFLGTLPILTLWRRPIRDIDRWVKKAEDLLIAVAATVVLAPLLAVTALLIKLTSPGPVLFVQTRFGFNNRPIQVYKFRSMYVDLQDVTGEARTRKNDARVTSIGRIIRKLSIDELPQLWNVIKGEMSIVGPRPHAINMKVGDVYYLDAVRGYGARHRVKPGITGLAQVRGLRGEIQTIERAKRRVELDSYYIDNWSIGLDLQIIFETIIGIANDQNAY